MHIWGLIVLHPITFPMADQLGAVMGSVCRYSTVVYGAMLQPSVEDFKFLFDHL